MPFDEIPRTLREFYPEPSLRHQVHYAFAHQFLPQYVWQNPYAFFSYLYRQDLQGGVVEPTQFIHSRWSVIFEKRYGLNPRGSDPAIMPVFRRVSDLCMSIQELDGRPSALVQMPKPEQSPQAFFVCAVLLAPVLQASSWSRDVQARVFTLEAVQDPGDGNIGVICEWSREDMHDNYGLRVRAERGVFLQALAPLLAAANSPSHGWQK